MKELVGPYRIQSLLGHGGMGVVYLGVHDHLGREVAIKALAPELTQHPQFRERFFTEARVQAKLQHTNIVTIYDLIEDGGSFFIVMEHVPGPTLESLLKGGVTKDWETDHSLALFRQILAGLDYAHSKGVIHRDVKSSNVLVADGDQVKLTDFGIALLVGDKRLTASQSTIGTPTYMSPEQILRPRMVDHRSDVYSAAIVLYEMLAGQPPFEAETEYEIKKLQIEAPVPDLRIVNPTVPAAIAEAITTALRKDPDERFQSAGAFLRALRTQAASAPALSSAPDRVGPAAPISPVSVEPASTPADPFSRLLFPPWKRWALAASLVLLAGFSLLFLFRPNEEEPARQELVAEAPPVQAPVALKSPVVEPSAAPTAELLSAQLAFQTEETPTLPPPRPTVMEPPPSVPRESTKKDAEDLELTALREGIRKRMESVRQKIAKQDFEGARREVSTLHTIVEGRPRGLERESESLRRLEESLDNAIQAHQRAEQAREWESQLQAARNAMAQGNRSKARDLAQALLDTPGLSESTASQARELIEQSKELPPTNSRAARKLTVEGVEINPQVVGPGGRAVAVAHVTVNPPFEQSAKVNVRARVMKNLGEIADPISQAVTIPAGGGTWKVTIPIKIPKRVPSGDCYVDIELWDSTQQVKGSGRIGFTIQ